MLPGRGINRQIRRACGYLASRYKPGDRIFLMGFSRRAYAVRALAKVTDMVGLLHADHARERNIRDVYGRYECAPGSAAAKAFAVRHCHRAIDNEMTGVWDTVKALGVNVPLIWRWSAPRHAFHNHHPRPVVWRAYHALARHL